MKSHGTETAFVLKAHGKYSLHMFTYAYPLPPFYNDQIFIQNILYIWLYLHLFWDLFFYML